MVKTNDNHIILEGLEGNDPITLSPLQTTMKEHLDLLVLFWWSVWVCVLLYVMYNFLFKELSKRWYNRENEKQHN